MDVRASLIYANMRVFWHRESDSLFLRRCINELIVCSTDVSIDNIKHSSSQNSNYFFLFYYDLYE